MADQRAQEIINQVASLTGDFGASVTVKRIAFSSDSPVQNAFGTDLKSTTTTFTAKVIIEALRKDQMPTLIGQRAKEELRLITTAGIFQSNDVITYGGFDYRVQHIEPVPFVGSDVVNFVHAFREVM